MAEKTRDALWFVKNRGLATGGVDITSLTKDDISVAEIEGVFGPKFSKSGYRYDKKPSQKVVANIEELYCRVTGRSKVLNSTINQCFARGVVAWLKGEVLDWAKYVVHCHKTSSAVNTTKQLNRERKEQATTGQEGAKSLRKHTIAKPGTYGSGQPLYAKLESDVVGMPINLWESSKRGGPQWKEEDIFRVNELSKTLNKVLLGARKHVLEAQEQYANDVATSQVSTMQLEGREKVFLDSESHKVQLDQEMSDLVTKHQLQSKLPSLVGDGINLENGCRPLLPTFTVLTYPSEICEVQQKLEWATRSGQIALSMLNISRQECEAASKKVVISAATLATSKPKVVDVLSHILLVDQQLAQMKIGGGSCLYPQPIISSNCDSGDSGNFGGSTVIEIHDCPICGRGFKLNDILVANCGHTYHLICMNWHVSKSLSCKVPSCGKDFHKDWLKSVGLRPVHQDAVDATEGKKMMKETLIVTSPKLEHTMMVDYKDLDFANLKKDSSTVLVGDIGPDGWDAHVLEESIADVGEKDWDTLLNDVPNCSKSFGTHSVDKHVISSLESKQGSSIPDIRSGIEISSPLKRRQSTVFGPDKASFVKPALVRALDLSLAFDTSVVPQLEQTSARRVEKQDRKPLQMEISGALHETLCDSESEDSDSEPTLQPGLVHYPPRPILGREAKHDHTTVLSDDEVDSEDEDNALGHTKEATTLKESLSFDSIVVKIEKGTEGAKQQIEDDNVMHSICVTQTKLPTVGEKRQRGPCSPNPNCEKRVTRREAADTKLKILKKPRKGKKKEKVPKNFNSFA